MISAQMTANNSWRARGKYSPVKIQESSQTTVMFSGHFHVPAVSKD